MPIFRWVRILEDREARDDEDSYSVSSAELVNAFSVRVVVVDDEQRAVARTKEALVGSGASSCQGLGGIPQDIRVDGGLDSLSFTWQEPDCDETETAIVGYEYTVRSFFLNFPQLHFLVVESRRRKAFGDHLIRLKTECFD